MGYEEISFSKLFYWDFNNSRQKILFFIFRIDVYGPLLASLLVTFGKSNFDGLKNLWRRMTKWRVHIKGYLYLLLIPIVINLFAVFAGMIIGLLQNPVKNGHPFRSKPDRCSGSKRTAILF